MDMRIRHSQAGVTLIEALIAGVILAIGILGVVSLITMSKVSQHQAIQRTRAVALADNILERIRRNPAGLATYNGGLANPLGNASITNEPSPDCSSATCTTVEMAAHDLWAWEQLLDGTSVTVTDGGTTTATAGMRSLRGCIIFTADTGKTSTGIVSVVLQWQGLSESTDAVAAGGDVCGGDAAGTDDTRRQIIINSYVIDEQEL